MNRCPVCADNSCRSRAEPDGTLVYDCPRCGIFAVPSAFVSTLALRVENGVPDRSALSHHIRTMPRRAELPAEIDADIVASLRGRIRPLTPSEQQDKLILWAGDNQPTPGQFIQSRKKPLSAIVGCHVTVQSAGEPELDWLLNQMKPLGYFDLHMSNQASVVALRLTLRGWDHYHELQRRARARRTAFMPLPGETAALGTIVDGCFKPVAAQAGFELVAENGALEGGVADERRREMIRAAPFMLADLTAGDAGVLFAAGFAEGLGLPVIYTCEESRIADRQAAASAGNPAATIPWRAADFGDAARRLAAALEATFPDRRLPTAEAGAAMPPLAHPSSKAETGAEHQRRVEV